MSAEMKVIEPTEIAEAVEAVVIAGAAEVTAGAEAVGVAETMEADGTQHETKDFQEYHNHARPELLQAFFRAPGLVLEVGCGGGATGHMIKERWPDAQVFGMDIDQASLDLAKTVLDGVIRAEKDPTDTDLSWQTGHRIGEGSVDTLILADVLEHLENPWKVLRWLRPYLTNDAQIIVSLPNVRNLGVMQGLRVGHWRYAVSGILDVTHLRFFTRESAISLLAECGYEVMNQGSVWDSRLSQHGRAGCTTLINMEGCAFHGVSPKDFDEMAALQHILTARINALALPVPVDAMEVIPAQAENKNAYPMHIQATPTMEESWRDGQGLMDAERDWLLEASRQDGFPSFAVLMRQTVRNSLQSHRSAESVTKQVVEAGQVVILREPSSSPVLWPDIPAAEIVHGESWEDALRALPKNNNGPRWLAFVDSGDFLETDALARLGIAIQTHPNWRVVYSDEDQVDDMGRHGNPHCKPDFHLDTVRSLPYIGGLLAIREDFLQAIGGLSEAFPGAEEYDLVLRAAEVILDAPQQIIGHVARVLYHRGDRSGPGKYSIQTIIDSGRHAVAAHLRRCEEVADVEYGPAPATYRPVYALPYEPLVTILIPTKNQFGLLRQCIDTVIEKTDYTNFEIVIIDNSSTEPDARQFLDNIQAHPEAFGDRIRVFSYPGAFNYTAMHNAAVKEAARGEVLLFLNNDTAALHPEWLRNMMRHALRPQVGAVGAKLLFPDGKIQHAGVIMGLSGGGADHPFIGMESHERGYYGRLVLTQNYEAVTAACMAVRREMFDAVDGFSAEFPIQFNDVDLCLKIGAMGKRIVWTPDAILMHHGSASQRAEAQGNAQAIQKSREVLSEGNSNLFKKWPEKMAHDTAYNPNFSRHGRGFQFQQVRALAWQEDFRPRKRILAHPINQEGTGEYRVISPARALARSGRLQVMDSFQLLTVPEMLQFAPDSMVFQLQMEHFQMDMIKNWKAHCPDTFRVFEVDDLVIHLPMKNAHRPFIHKDIVQRFRNALRQTDRLVVTTEFLAEQYNRWADDIRVVPNYVERARWGEIKVTQNDTDRPRVGWVGGVSHQGDLEIIQDIVRATYKEIDWVFMGMCPDSMRPYVTFVPPVPFDQYPQKIATLGLDLALAPLELHPFNEGKSHLRILEMGILGIPVLCTDILPYQGFPVWRVKNRYQDWLGAVQDLTRDREALRAAGEALKAHVMEHWMLEDHLDVWESAWLR